MSVPLQIYDFIAIILPASLLMAILRFEDSGLKVWQQDISYGGVAGLFLVSYLLGHVIAIYGRRFEKSALTSWFFNRKFVSPREGQMVFNGRKSPVILSENVGEEILKSLSEFYGFKIEKDDAALFELLYSPIHDRMGKRDIFLAISNMFRSLMVISIAYAVYLVGKITEVGLSKHTFGVSSAVLLVIDVVLFLGFRSGFQSNKTYAEAIPFTAFLAWYKQLKA